MNQQQALFDGIDPTPSGPMSSGSYGVLPEGNYLAIITKAGRKWNKAGTGEYAQMDYEIIEGEFKGSRYTSRLNLWNQNETSRRMAKQELTSLRDALGLTEEHKEASDYENKPCIISMKPNPRSDDPSRLENKLVMIFPASGAVPQTPAQAQPYQAPTQTYQAPVQQGYQQPVQQPPQQVNTQTAYQPGPRQAQAPGALPWATARR